MASFGSGGFGGGGGRSSRGRGRSAGRSSGGRGGGRGRGGGTTGESIISRLSPCSDFTTKGSCPRGDSCRFAHVVCQHASLEASSIMPHNQQNSTNNGYNNYNSHKNYNQKAAVSSVAIWETNGAIKIFTGSHDGFWRLWSTTGSQFQKEFEHNMNGGKVECLEVQSNFLFCGFEAVSITLPDVNVGMIHAWNLNSPNNPPLELHIHPLIPYAHSSCVTCLKVVNGDTVLSGDHSGVIRVWKYDTTASTFQLQETIHGHAGEITGLVLVDSILWSSSVDRSIRLWDLSKKGECQYIISGQPKPPTNQVVGHTDAVTCLLTFQMPNNGGTFVLSSSLDGNIKAWNGSNGECVASEANGEGVITMALSADTNGNPLLLIGLARGNIMVRNVLQTPKAPAFCSLLTLNQYYNSGHQGPVKAIREGPQSTFYTGGDDGKLNVLQIVGDLGL